jgi:hypothetical protein
MKEQKYSSFCQSSKRCEKIEVSHINKDSSPLYVLMFFTEIFHMLVEQNNVFVRNVMAQAQTPELVFQQNGRIHLNPRGGVFSRVLAVEECGSADECIIFSKYVDQSLKMQR